MTSFAFLFGLALGLYVIVTVTVFFAGMFSVGFTMNWGLSIVKLKLALVVNTFLNCKLIEFIPAFKIIGP